MPADLEKFFKEQNEALKQKFPLQWNDEIEGALKKTQESLIRDGANLGEEFANKLQNQWTTLFNPLQTIDGMHDALNGMEDFLNKEADQYVKAGFKEIIKIQLNIDDQKAEEFLKEALGDNLPRISPTRLKEILSASTSTYEAVAQPKLDEKSKKEQLMKISLQFVKQEAESPEHAKSIKDPTWFWRTVADGNQSWQNFYVAERERQLQKVAMGRSVGEATEKLEQLGKHLLAIDNAVKEALEKALQFSGGIAANITDPNFKDPNSCLDHEKIRCYVTSKLYEAMAANPDCIKHGPANIIKRIRSIPILNDKDAARAWSDKVLQVGAMLTDTLEKFIHDLVAPIPQEVAQTMQEESKQKPAKEKAVNEHFRKRRKDVDLSQPCFKDACLYEMEKGSKTGTTVYEALTRHLKETHPGSSWKVNVGKLQQVDGKEAVDINERVSKAISERLDTGGLNRAQPTEQSERKLSYSFNRSDKTDPEVDTTPPTVNIISRNGKVDVEVVGPFNGVVRVPRIDKEFGEPIKGLYDVFEFKDGLLMASVKLDNLRDVQGRETESQVGRVRTDLGVIAHVVSTKEHSSAVTPPVTPGSAPTPNGHGHGHGHGT